MELAGYRSKKEQQDAAYCPPPDALSSWSFGPFVASFERNKTAQEGNSTYVPVPVQRFLTECCRRRSLRPANGGWLTMVTQKKTQKVPTSPGFDTQISGNQPLLLGSEILRIPAVFPSFDGDQPNYG